MDYEVIYFAFYCLGCNWVTSEHIYLFNPILPQLVTNPLYGNCFNIFAADESFGKSSLTGSSYGLVLELDVEQEDYLQGGQVTRSPPLTPPSKDKRTCDAIFADYVSTLPPPDGGCRCPRVSPSSGRLPPGGGVRGGRVSGLPHQSVPPAGEFRDFRIRYSLVSPG